MAGRILPGIIELGLEAKSKLGRLRRVSDVVCVTITGRDEQDVVLRFEVTEQPGAWLDERGSIAVRSPGWVGSLGTRVTMPRASAHLAPELLAEVRELVDPVSPNHLLRLPHFSMTWLNVLAFGRKPAGAARSTPPSTQ